MVQNFDLLWCFINFLPKKKGIFKIIINNSKGFNKNGYF